jgi:hypothetical protein
MPQVDFRLGASPLFALLAIGIAAFLAYLYYRTTLPPISGVRRWILLTLRGTALALLLALLLEPVVRIVSSRSDPPVLTILIDNSKSLSITDRQGQRSAAVRALLNAPVFERLRSRAELRYVAFGISTRSLPADSLAALSFSDDGTDLAGALRTQAAGSTAAQPHALLVISDGVATIGQNPVYGAEALGVPVYTIGIGEAAEQRDIAISQISTNSIVYSGVPAPVDVLVKSTGFPGQQVTVTLSDQGTILDRKPLLMAEGTKEYAVSLSYVPDGSGVRSYAVSVSSLEGELTAKNNRRSFTARIRKSKLRILIIAGAPSPDVAVIRQTLNEMEQFTVRSFTQTPAGGFYDGSLASSLVDSADCLFLLGFPAATTDPSVGSMVFSSAAARRIPLLVQVSRSTDLARFGQWTSLLPFVTDAPSRGEEEVSAEATAAERLTPVLTPATTGDENPWTQLPPLFAVRLPLRVRPDATVLVTARTPARGAAAPLVLIRRANQQRVLTVLLHDLWRWRLMAQRSAVTQEFFPAFLSNAVHWLTAPDAEGPVIARPLKESFAQGEPLTFSAEVYDSRQRPVEDAEVRVMVQRGNQVTEGLLLPRGNGRYDGETPGMHTDGSVRYRVTATRPGVVSGSDSGTVQISGTAIEFLNTRMDADVLQQLAARTGGGFLRPESVGALDSLLAAQPSFAPRTTTSITELHFRNWPWYAALIVLLLAVEWFLRKRSGMI